MFFSPPDFDFFEVVALESVNFLVVVGLFGASAESLFAFLVEVGDLLLAAVGRAESFFLGAAASRGEVGSPSTSRLDVLE